ncbi:MAG: DUF4834 family protein [Bacteroidales bacterium]|nr:DUF4834 family protein [Bacteroidales bacterium]
MGLIRTLIILAVIYFVFRYVMRVLIPMMLGNYINNKVNQTQDNFKKQHKSGREGDVTINYTSANSKKNKDTKGEYVDFEEIKE